MEETNLLARQVRAEMKKRRLVFFTFVILAFSYLSLNLLFGEMGFLRYMELRRTRQNLERQIQDIHRQNDQLRSQLKQLKEDPFARERLAREEYGMAKPDELIFQYDR